LCQNKVDKEQKNYEVMLRLQNNSIGKQERKRSFIKINFLLPKIVRTRHGASFFFLCQNPHNPLLSILLLFVEMTDKDRFLAFCQAELGKPYHLGECGPEAYDCSGLLVAGIQPHTDFPIPRISTDQYALGSPVSMPDAQPGDLVFFDTGWTNRKPNHLGVCVQNGVMINANSHKDCVAQESFSSGYWNSKLYGIRRIFDAYGNFAFGENPLPSVPDFEDVPPDYPEYEYIMALRKKGIVQGYPGNIFRPEKTVTRAEALKIILMSFDIPIGQYSSSDFSDVRPTDWFLSVVETAKEKGIINGYPDGTFRPNSPINRVEISKVILETGEANIPHVSESEFSDVPNDSWFCEYAHEVARRKMFVLVDNRFLPSLLVTRAQMCRAIILFLRSA
jgi:hypothetical protein